MDGKDAVVTEFVQGHLANASQWLANVWRQRQVDYFCTFPRNIESPLEAAFIAWWAALAAVGMVNESMYDLVPQYEVGEDGSGFRIDCAILPKIPLSNALRKRGLKVRAVAIELDGHDFHERTKEQVAYRNQRDRRLLSDGWVVLHFSGSEMNRQPVECVHQAAQQASRLIGELNQAVIDKGGYEDVFDS